MSARLAAICAVSCALAACDDNRAPPFPEGQGQAPGGSSSRYPAGPYGVTVGDVISNFGFVGYPDPETSTEEKQAIQLADFWNPTGEDTFPEGSIFGAGEPKPTVLAIVLSAVWCGPCHYEASELLPEEHAKYAPQGGQFLLVLVDGPSQGSPAELSQLIGWTSKYETRFPAVIDPQYQMGSLFPSTAFPANILVDTKTMQVLEVVSGIPEEGSPFFQQLEAHLRP